MGLFTAIGANLGAAAAEAMKPAIGVVEEFIIDKDKQIAAMAKLEEAYSDKSFELKIAMASGSALQRMVEPIKEFVKIFIILCIFIIFPLLEPAFNIHIDILKYLDSMPMIGWIVLVASDLGPNAINKLIDFQVHKANVKYGGK